MEPLIEKFLKELAKEKGITLKESLLGFDKCILKVSAQTNTSYSDVYNLTVNEKFLTNCLKGKCSKLDIKKCKKSCHCVEYYDENNNFVCISKKIKNSELINSDPDKYILNNLSKTKDLKKLVHLSSYLYYNYDGGGLTDNSFDALQYHLNKREKFSQRKYEKIGAPPVEKIKSKLPYPMPSLSKTKPGTKELLDFLKENNNISYSLKLDGVSGMLIYKEGKLKKIYTRGDGVIGGDVTYLKDYVKNIPKKISEKNLVVRGEFILNKTNWEKYKGTFSNARNFVSSRINSGHIAFGIEDIEFIAYKMMKKNDDELLCNPFQTLLMLNSYGFVIIENGILINPTVFEIMELYKEQRNKSYYFIDGLVLTYNKPYFAVKNDDLLEFPRDTVAFKMLLEEQIRNTTVLDVEWNISKHGKYIPVAIYESVYIGGVRLRRASAHNASHIQDWNMGKGTKIKISRSGDVIPFIQDVLVDKKIIPIYPNITYNWHWDNKNIILDDIESNKYVQIKRIYHFFETISVPRLGEKIAEKLWESGYTNPEKIAGASIDDFIKIKGFAKKSATSLYENIHNIMQKTPIDRYLIASTTFSSGLGRKIIKQLFKSVPDIFETKKEDIKKKLKGIKGFGPKRIENIYENMPKFRKYLFSFGQEDIKKAIKYNETKRENLIKKGLNLNLKGKNFVFTGFYGNDDYDLEDYIYDNDGDILDNVSSSIEAVISKNILDITSKMKKATELKIKVLSLDEFREKYNIPKNF